MRSAANTACSSKRAQHARFPVTGAARTRRTCGAGGCTTTASSCSADGATMESCSTGGRCVGARGAAGGAQAGGSPPIERIATLGGGAQEIADAGVGASFWDLYGRTLAARDGGVTIDDVPLRLMRFPRFEQRNPQKLSLAQNRIRVGEVPELNA